MGATAQFAAGADVEHTHGFAVFLAEQHHRAGFLGRLDVHHPRLGGGVGQDFGVDAGFDLGDLGVSDRAVVGEVKTGALGVDQAALLLHVGAQHFAQGLVHQVRGAVVTNGGGSHCRVDLGSDGVTHVQRAGLHGALVAKHVGLDLLRVAHCEAGGAAGEYTFITHLAARLGIERCGVEHHGAGLAFIQGCNAHPVCVERYYFCSGLQRFVTHEGVNRTGVFQRTVHLELACGAAHGLLAFHGGGKTGFVHRQAAFTRHVGRQIEREAVGVV